jgi:hypothetical protein
MTGRDLMERLGSLIGCLATLFVFGSLFVSEPLWTLVSACLLAMIVFGFRWLIWRQERKRLLGDCHQQHAALMKGHDAYGLYGNFPIPDLDSPQDENP